MIPSEYHQALVKLRSFFVERGFIETPVQHRLSILAACEDPTTVSEFSYSGQTWPLPQTGQMWLEHELLHDPSKPGFFCISTSYRAEADPIPGRHDLIFPMFEFEMHGDVGQLIELERDLLTHMGFGADFVAIDYEYACKQLGCDEVGPEQEEALCSSNPVTFLTRFPQRTSPFWNMQRNDDGSSAKVDVLMFGIETIGSAERSCDPGEMRRQFYGISDGMYAKRLFAAFGKRRVEEELEAFLSNKFFVRSGGGIGLTRLVKALKAASLLV